MTILNFYEAFHFQVIQSAAPRLNELNFCFAGLKTMDHGRDKNLAMKFTIRDCVISQSPDF
jgi:hypothetical protein